MDDGRETDHSCLTRVAACFLLCIIYIASLYIWSSSQDRNHPSTIKRRFFSVFVMTLISPIFLYYFSQEKILKQSSVLQLLGVRKDGLIVASTLPLLLTMVLFLGPIVMQSTSVPFKSYLTLQTWLPDWTNIMWLRNQVVAPLSEEFTFRACMMPLLLQCLHTTTAIALCPLIFGLAHFHHMVENVRGGMPFNKAFLISSFQFSYTTLFGAYSAFLFVRTGHLIAPFLAHAFCNHMGFPDFPELLNKKQPYKYILMTLFILGLVSWSFLLFPLTEPSWYENNLFWIQKNETFLEDASENIIKS